MALIAVTEEPSVSYVLDGQVAVVTGGAGGIGHAVCEGFAAAGATVVIVDVAGVEEAAEALGSNAYGVTVDVADADEVGALMAEVNERFGGPHILVTLAGGSLGTPPASTRSRPTTSRACSTST